MNQQIPFIDRPTGNSPAKQAAWKTIVHAFQQPSAGRSAWQLANSVGGYLLLWGMMYLTSAISYWLTVPLAILAGGLLLRIFIIFHDCTHNSFFRSRKANEVWGFITGVLCFTPYHHWKWEHTIHHAHAGDLDSRGFGDVWTLTVDEYLKASRFTKLRYRLNRNPLILFLIAPPILFLVLHRIPSPKASAKAKRSVHYNNIAIAILAGMLIWIFGWRAYLIIQMTGVFVAAGAGVWLFYIQHQFEGVAWEHKEDWDFTQAALQGSSFYSLPKILQWFSGNIGFHHIHHLSPHIPNYNLESCHKADPLFQTVPPITLRSSLKSFNFRLWDEKSRRLVGFSHLKQMRRQPRTVAA